MSAQQQKEEIIITSIVIAAIISVLIVFIPHLGAGNSMKIMPKSDYASTQQSFNSPFNTYTYSSAVEWASYKCGFGSYHSIEVEGKTVGDFMNDDLSLDQKIKSTFEHLGLITSISIVLAVIILILRLINNDQKKFKEI